MLKFLFHEGIYAMVLPGLFFMLFGHCTKGGNAYCNFTLACSYTLVATFVQFVAS